MGYVVYVNHPTNKATIHDTACGRYTMRKRNTSPNGFWTQSYANMQDALKYAQSTGKKTVDTGSFCCEPIS